MTIFLAVIAAVGAVTVIVLMMRLAPARTERVRRTAEPAADGQGTELAPRDGAS